MRDFLSFCRHLFDLLSFVRAVFAFLMLLLLACAVGLAFVEDLGLGDAIYFTLITGLTIGYGDIAPTTGFGRVLSVVAGVIGLVYIGLVVAVATRALAQAAEEKRREGAPD